MVLCSRCKKRPAVVFITAMNGDTQKNEGLCMICAKEMKIPQIKDYMEQLGITDEEIEQISEQMMELVDGDSFEPGGASTLLPPFIQDMINEASDPQNSKSGFGSLFGGFEKTDSKKKQNDKKKEKKLKFLENYCTNLSKKAEEGKIDNIIGRDKEISRVVQILSRRTKNNPCLIGEPGVGKTAIAEGIARRINEGTVPYNLRDKKVYLLDLTALVAGTQFRGQFESRVKGLVDEVKSEGDIILFVDEVHNLVGAGDSEGSMNAANILKPALSRGEVQVIGATTFNEYRKYIEKDSALERRFQPVSVNEPTIEETLDILKGIKEHYEQFHRVKITDDLLRMCAVLSERYINDRFLPDKAIDLLDESCACTAIESTVLASYDKITAELAALEEQEREIEESDDPDFEKLAAVKGDIIRKREEVAKTEEEKNNVYVTESNIAKVIELWTGIPANKVAQTEFRKIADLEENLKKRVIGQDEAVSVLSKAIKRTRVQLSKRRRPASFIFVGPTGVGKTELVKVLAEEMFDSTEPLIRLDMTEFMEKHAVSKLIGSPPGYVGYDEAGQLTEKVRRKPYSVILFDEIEKAHPDVMNILLQILDEGKLDDSQGRSVNFENTIIAMTSNAGSTDKSTGVGFNKTAEEISKDKAIKGLREFLRPEFISRIDEIVVFEPLSKESYAKIAGLMIDEMKEPLLERAIELTYDEKVLELIADKSFDKKFGARDIRKVIRKDVEDKVANEIIEHPERMIKKLHITADESGKEIIVKMED
ncbi:MAG: ATP-dependent Clp protease ATP-binding subunit [Ruminococcus sp.]|nr:ATP-dependent Clp protease ATP-binding subunit [Ruminococcus sp.]